MGFAKIRNAQSLLSHGDSDSRRLVLEVADEVLKRLDSYNRLNSLMRRDGCLLYVGKRTVDLKAYNRVYVFCAGKAANHMVRAFEDILGEYLTRGVAIVKIREDIDVFSKTELFVGGHPLPNEQGMDGCRRMIQLAEQMDKNDLLLVGLSGGSTALMGYPVEEISFDDFCRATDVLIKSGMDVMEINDVRGHLCRMNRGQLGQHIRGTEILCFEIWDAAGLDNIVDYSEPAQIVGTPVGYDTATFGDVKRILEAYSLKERLPQSVVKYIMDATPAQETPKTAGNVSYYVLNILPDICDVALDVAKEKGVPAAVITTYATGESRDYGAFMAALAKEIVKNARPFTRPCMILSAGETTTLIEDDSTVKGSGGPSLEMAAGFALAAKDTPGVCLFSIDSEGTDGTSIFAGGLTDSTTYSAAAAKGINLRKALKEHAAGEALGSLGDCVFTGNTGTNLCDLNIVYIP